jgi:CrcB protein
MSYLYIGLFGSLGVLSRHFIGQLFKSSDYFYLGTLLVNIIGCYIIGHCYKLILQADHNQAIMSYITIGFCGGLTTFSSFGLDIFKLFQTQDHFKMILYISLTMVLSLIALFLGHKLAS